MTRNYVNETGSMTGILGQIEWEFLPKKRKDNRLILLYKGLQPTDYIIPKCRRCKKQHPMPFQIPYASKDAYRNSSIPRAVSDWNDLPDSLISSAELTDDCVSKFTSFVRARD